MRRPRGPWCWYAAALGCYVLALCSKTVTASLPAALLVVTWWRRGRIGWRDVLPLLPWFAVGVPMGLFTAWMEKVHVGAEGVQWTLTALDLVVLAGRTA